MDLRSIVIFAIIGILMFLLPFFGEEFIMSTAYTILMFITLAEAYNIFGGFGGYVNFGYSAFYGLGAYLTAILSVQWHKHPLLMVPISALLVGALTAVMGVPLLRLRGIYFAIGMITVNYIFFCLILLFPGITRAGEGIVLPPPPSVKVFYYLMLGIAIATVISAYLISKSSFGLALRSIREDEEVAEVMGVNTTKYKIMGFVASVIPAAIVGGINSSYLTYIDPPTCFNIALSVEIILMARLGGLGTISGPVLGAVIIQSISYVLRYSLGGGVIHKIIWGALLAAVVIFLPQGVSRFLRESRRAPSFLKDILR